MWKASQWMMWMTVQLHQSVAKVRKAYTLHHDHLHKEDKTGYSRRRLPSEGNRGSNMLDRPSSRRSLLPPWGLG